MAWMLGRNPHRHHGLLSYSDQVSWARSRAVKQLIEASPAYKLVFPDVKPYTKKWGDTEFILDIKKNSKRQRRESGDPHPTLRAGGATSAVVAYRLNGLLFDDPHDQKNSASPQQREKVHRNYNDAIKTRLTSDAWQVLIGTRWAEDDFIGYVTKQKGWQVLHTRALSSNGRSYWPEAYDFDFLDTIRFETPNLFAVQYLGDTTGGEAGIIRHVRTYSDPPLVINKEKKLLVGIGLDTAMKEREKNDFSVGYVGGLDRYGRLYLLDRFKGRWGLPELLDQLTDYYEKWRPTFVWVEDTANGTAAVQTLVSQSTMPVVPVPYTGDKYQRANTLSPYLHGGHVLFPRYAEWYEDSKFQLTHFGNTRHDDDLDALFILVDELIQMRHPSHHLRRPKIKIRMR
jgi:predicted phage terminase large subunit-like protein